MFPQVLIQDIFPLKFHKLLRASLPGIFARRPHFSTRDVVVGRHVSFGRNVVFNCQRVRIGDGTIFQDDIVINADVFEVGDYATFYSHCFVPGPGELRIGHNFWLGTNSIIDSMGGTFIGNNVCVAAHSQLWTHMKYGDVMYGCRFHSKAPLRIGNDVWLGAHSLVGPITIGDRSLVLFGSVVTKDVAADRSYAGVPAQDITDKVGAQFGITTLSQRRDYLRQKLAQYDQAHPDDRILQRVTISTEPLATDATSGGIVFNVADRTYTKRRTQLEYRLMRFLLPDAKFLPIDEPESRGVLPSHCCPPSDPPPASSS
jgi:acetyltransferase-like isoleucine patch superfamily enzyme